MAINIARFYKREQWKLECEIVTPMFLGNARQEAELRAAPFKGLLRYWWRVANGWRYSSPGDLLRAENDIFGSPDDTGGKSRVAVEIGGDPQCFAAQQFPSGATIRHPNVQNRPIDRFLYLGYGPITGSHALKCEGKGAFRPAQKITVCLRGQTETLNSLRSTLHCWQQFGAIGGRSRNGWGCFSATCSELPQVGDATLFQQIGGAWESCFSRDYPHRLGVNGNRMLLWRGKNPHQDWKGVMNELAEIYLTLRLEHTFHGGGPHATPQDRHALGYPAGRNHSVLAWGNQGRHGSALRLIVRKETDGLRGYFLHLPHLFSTEMWPNGKDRQIAIWTKVHSTLDKLCHRAHLEEARP